jgi:adhesin/invasin
MTTTRTLLASLFVLPVVGGACGDDEPCVPGAGEICTYAGDGQNGYFGDDGSAVEASLSLPMDTRVAPDGTLYILDWNNHRIRQVTADGMMKHVAGRGELGGTLDDPANSDFNHPTGMLFDPDGGALYIAAWHNSMIRAYDLDTGNITDSCGDGRRAYFGDGGPAEQATLDLPASIVFDPQGRMVIMDQANQVIRRINDDGTIERIAGQCLTLRPGGCGGAPYEQCPGGSGKWSCDPDACGEPCGTGYGGDGGPALDAQIAQPFGQSALPGGRLLYDPDGNLLFADASNNLIRKIDTDGIITTIAGTPPVDGMPQRGYSGDGGPATDALLSNPVDLAMTGDGTLYFSDVDNHVIRAIDPDGTIRTVAGEGGVPGYDGDGGLATDALLKYPFGIELDGDTMYIADMGNSVIRQLVLP